MEDTDDWVVRGGEEATVGLLRLLELRRAHSLRGVATLRIKRWRLILMLLLAGEYVHRRADKALLLLLLVWHISGDALESLTLFVKCDIEV